MSSAYTAAEMQQWTGLKRVKNVTRITKGTVRTRFNKILDRTPSDLSICRRPFHLFILERIMYDNPNKPRTKKQTPQKIEEYRPPIEEVDMYQPRKSHVTDGATLHNKRGNEDE